MPTPAQLEQQLQADRSKRTSLNSKISLQNSFSAGPQAPEPQSTKGIDKLNQQINVTVEGVRAKATTEIFGIATALGIVGIGTPNVSSPETCPDPRLIREMLQRRNALISQIETAAVFINIVDGVLNIISRVISGTQTTIQALNLIKIATAAASQILPYIPGAIPAAISSFDDIRTILTFKSDGNPRLPELKRSVDTGSTYVTRAALVFNSILLALRGIDLFLEKCGETPGEPNGDLNNITSNEDLNNTTLRKPNEDLNNLIIKGQIVSSSDFETSYKGFTFRIIEKPFSPTVNRKIGQALNSQGIVLLQTDPSFTTDPQVLIEELKLIIDRDNLKAN